MEQPKKKTSMSVMEMGRLRLLGCAAHNVSIASIENIQMISDKGYKGLDEVLEKYREDLDTSE